MLRWQQLEPGLPTQGPWRSVDPGHCPSPLWLYPFRVRQGTNRASSCVISALWSMAGSWPCPSMLPTPLMPGHLLLPTLPVSSSQRPQSSTHSPLLFLWSQTTQVSSLSYCPSIGLDTAYTQVPTTYTLALPKLVPILYPSSETLHPTHRRLKSAKRTQGFIKVSPYHILPPPTTLPPCLPRQLRKPPNLTSLKVLPILTQVPPKYWSPQHADTKSNLNLNPASQPVTSYTDTSFFLNIPNPIPFSHHEMSPQNVPSTGSLPNSTQNPNILQITPKTETNLSTKHTIYYPTPPPCNQTLHHLTLLELAHRHRPQIRVSNHFPDPSPNISLNPQPPNPT